MQDETVDRLAAERHRDHRQLQDGGADVGRSRRRQRDDVEHQRGAVVGAAGSSAAATSALAVSSGAERSRRMSAMLWSVRNPCTPSLHNRKRSCSATGWRGVVEAHFRLDAERAGQRVRAAGAFLAHMVGGQAGQAVAAQPIGAGIADMQQMGDAAAQHQRGERAAHSGELGILAAHRIDPAVERADDRAPRRAAPPSSRADRKTRRGSRAPRSRPRCGRPWRRRCRRRSPRPPPGAARAVPRRTARRRNPRCALRGPVFEANPTLARTPTSTAAMAPPFSDRIRPHSLVRSRAPTDAPNSPNSTISHGAYKRAAVICPMFVRQII